VRNWDQEKFKRIIQPLENPSEKEYLLVEAIAASTFSNLRFNLDPHIDNEKANYRYLKWLRNAYQNGEDVRIIRHKGEVAGFCLFRHGADNRTVFRLAAIREDLKGSGLGLSLFASAVAYCQHLGVRQIDGGISTANTHVLNVMSMTGFVFRDPTLVFHYRA
jgi:GNAT superfamily N-acetyltransferase